jgi:hypothetical protein
LAASMGTLRRHQWKKIKRGSCLLARRSIHRLKLRHQQSMGCRGGGFCLRPMMVPMLHTKGITAYAFAAIGQHLSISSIANYLRSCLGFLTSSPTMVWTTPMFPFSIPPRTLPASAIQKLDEKPTTKREDTVPKQPIRSTWGCQRRSIAVRLQPL